MLRIRQLYLPIYQPKLQIFLYTLLALIILSILEKYSSQINHVKSFKFAKIQLFKFVIETNVLQILFSFISDSGHTQTHHFRNTLTHSWFNQIIDVNACDLSVENVDNYITKIRQTKQKSFDWSTLGFVSCASERKATSKAKIVHIKLGLIQHRLTRDAHAERTTVRKRK